MNPVMCSECSWSQESSTFTVNGVSKKIYLAALVDGTLLADASKPLGNSEVLEFLFFFALKTKMVIGKSTIWKMYFILKMGDFPMSC